MLWWHILFCIISIHKIVHFVRSQDDDDEESTTVPLSTTTDGDEDQSIGRVSLIIPSRIINNGSEQNLNQINLNESSKQRIIIALAVLCAALAVLLGFFISLVVCQWLQHDKDGSDLSNRTNKKKSNLASSSYDYRQGIKL